MNSTRTNTLKLKFYNNIERLKRTQIKHEEQKRNTNKYAQGKNFMEFYIDGKSLINEVGKAFWNKNNSESYFDEHIGYLGSFDNETDLIFISLMLNFDSKKRTREFIKCNSSFDISEEKFEHIFEEIKEIEDRITLLYGCPCGDVYCGGIGTEIRKDEKYYYWVFGENDNVLSYKFNANEYQNEMTNYLKMKNRY